MSLQFLVNEADLNLLINAPVHGSGDIVISSLVEIGYIDLHPQGHFGSQITTFVNFDLVDAIILQGLH